MVLVQSMVFLVSIYGLCYSCTMTTRGVSDIHENDIHNGFACEKIVMELRKMELMLNTENVKKIDSLLVH